MTDFEQRYKSLYRTFYEFHRKHHNATTDEEWQAAANDLTQFGDDPFASEFAIAIYNEIAREAKSRET